MTAATAKQKEAVISPAPKLKRVVKVVAPEQQDGHVEYKRQLINPTATRLRSLATQMSYRLDEGHGTCTYLLGVEDDGCHSLLNYTTVEESARILECISRSLNAIVVKRTMIQNEIEFVNVNACGGNEKEDNINDDMDLVKAKDGSNVVRIDQAPVFKFDIKTAHGFEEKTDHNGNDIDAETATDDAIRLLNEDKGRFTRCEITVQRIETHVLDSHPIPLYELATGKSMDPVLPSDAINGVASQISNVNLNGHDASPSSSPSSAGTDNNANNDEKINIKPSAPTKTTQNHDNPQSSSNSVSETLAARNIRVAVVGNVDAGKSTLIGTLTTSSLDDGRGRSRTTIMKHRHEIESGRTSTASSHLMGFRHTGEPISGRDTIRANKRKTEDEIARESDRIVTLLDLAGHEKYLKTTIHGVSSGMSDYSMILVNSRHPPTHMTQHHLNLCCSFGIPTIIVFTKVDGCPEHAMKNSKEEVNKLLRAPDVGRKPFVIRNEKDITTCIGKLHILAPIIDISCVTGEGLDLIRKLLFALPKRRKHEMKIDRSFEFLVEDLFNVPGVGSVVSGFVNAGQLTVGSNCHVYVGPLDDGTFIRTVAKSAQMARINTTHIISGQSACLALAIKKEDKCKLRRGMVVLEESPTSTKEFDAEICVLKGEGTTIRKSYQAYVHILNVRQTAFAKSIEIVNSNATGLPPSHRAHNDDDDGIVLRPGSRARVRFEFAQRPEYVRPGMRMLFRDGRVRGVGIITGI